MDPAGSLHRKGYAMAQCYVMMPYGGTDPSKKSFFEGVFSSIIVTAARNAGFADSEIIREDHKGEAGSVSGNIVHHLATSDVLIADLTGQNANVFYELGVAHVFHKSSTVLICQKDSPIPFDVQGLNVVLYSTDITEVSDSVTRMTNAIVSRLKGTASADNTIHEKIPQLPVSLMAHIESDGGEQEETLRRLSAENQRLRKQLEVAGIHVDGKREARTPREILMSAKAGLPYAGEIALSRFRELSEDRDLEGFFDYLAEVVDRGYLTRNEIHSVIEICENTNSDLLVEAAVEVFATLYPDDTEIQTKLARQLARRPATREKALEVINEAIGLERDDEGNYCHVNITRLTHNNLARLFDTYLLIEAYDELVEVGYYVLDHGAEAESDMIYRNIFSALRRAHRLDEAMKLLPTIEAIGSAVSYYNIGFFYDSLNRQDECYRYFEKAMLTDPDDLDYPLLMAKQILNERLARTDDDTIASISNREASAAAAPFILYVITRARATGNTASLQEALQLLQRPYNGLTDQLDQVKAFLQGDLDQLSYHGTNTFPLQWCLEHINEG